MKTLHFEIAIDAPKKKVWEVMLGKETFRQWTSAFMEGSHFEGSWEEGSKISFFDPDKNGMVAVIAENRPYEFVSIKHIGIINKGVEDTESEEATKWTPAFENYTFSEENGQTKVVIDMDSAEEYEEMFSKTWPEALEKLKALAEK